MKQSYVEYGVYWYPEGYLRYRHFSDLKHALDWVSYVESVSIYPVELYSGIFSKVDIKEAQLYDRL